MSNREQSELSSLYRKIPRQRSPAHLDDAILGAAESLTPRETRRRIPVWMTVLATACVATLAIVIVEPLQENGYAPPAPASHGGSVESEEATTAPMASHVPEPAALTDDQAIESDGDSRPTVLAEDALGIAQNRFNAGRSQAPPSRNQPEQAGQDPPSQALQRAGAESREARKEAPILSKQADRMAEMPRKPAPTLTGQAADLASSRQRSAHAPSGAMRPTPCSAEWFAFVADLSGMDNGASGFMTPGSAAWRTRVEESLQPAGERPADDAGLSAWCQWVEENLR